MDKPSERQIAILNFIGKHCSEKGFPPSVREIARAVGLKSPSTVHSHLDTLQRLGYLRRDPAKPRTIELKKNASPYMPIGKDKLGTNVISIPLVGEITAGAPILAYENIEMEIPLPLEWFRSGNHFILKVRGDSMVDAGILSGDLAVIRQQKTAENGEIIAALLENEATLKRFYQEKDCIRLQPENASMAPIFTKDVSILGKLVTLLRTF